MFRRDDLCGMALLTSFPATTFMVSVRRLFPSFFQPERAPLEILVSRLIVKSFQGGDAQHPYGVFDIVLESALEMIDGFLRAAGQAVVLSDTPVHVWISGLQLFR